MTKTVDFIFDFASPNGYFCHKVIPDIEARTGAKFVYKPCLLGGIHKLSNNQAPMVAFAEIPLKMAYDLTPFCLLKNTSSIWWCLTG